MRSNKRRKIAGVCGPEKQSANSGVLCKQRVCSLAGDQLAVITGKPIKNKEISKYPEIKKDVAFILNREISSNDVIKVIKKAGSNLLKDIDIFDVYEGDHIEENKKQIAYSFIFGSNDRTLNEEEVDNLFRNIINKVNDEFKATIRDK